MPAVSVATSIVATAVPSGTEVLVAEEDFASLLYPFMEAQRSGRLRVRAVPLEHLADAVGSATGMVAVSHVQSADGTVADVSSLREATQRVGATLYLDATHSVGVLPVDSSAWQADYLACAAYKWLCCPRGVVFLYVERTHWSHPFSAAASWRGEAQPHAPHYGPVSNLTEDARRFDVSIGWHAWVGARKALEAVASLGDERRYEIALSLGRRLADRLDLPEPRAGILNVPIRSAEEARGALKRHRVQATVRRDTVRLSPHFYNSESDVDVAATALRPCRR
jgi:selenocysteine lyase/cysteine desulfurase